MVPTQYQIHPRDGLCFGQTCFETLPSRSLLDAVNEMMWACQEALRQGSPLRCIQVSLSEVCQSLQHILDSSHLFPLQRYARWSAGSAPAPPELNLAGHLDRLGMKPSPAGAPSIEETLAIVRG